MLGLAQLHARPNCSFKQRVWTFEHGVKLRVRKHNNCKQHNKMEMKSEAKSNLSNAVVNILLSSVVL